MLRVSSLYRLLRQLEHVALFSACFLAAVTQHADCFHIIIGEEGGKKWKPMATNARVEPRSSCQYTDFSRWQFKLPVFVDFCFPHALKAERFVLFPCFSLSARLCFHRKSMRLFVMTCSPSLHQGSALKKKKKTVSLPPPAV